MLLFHEVRISCLKVVESDNSYHLDPRFPASHFFNVIAERVERLILLVKCDVFRYFEDQTMKYRILVSNDDGFHSPGLLALRNAVADLGKVTTVAPATEQSGVGHAVTVSNPIKISKQKLAGQYPGYAVAGTPADCVKLAASVLLRQEPHLLISGINLGPNVGISVIYSGTVSAAAEGTILGIPSMAVSLDTFTNPRWSTAGHIARRLATHVLRNGLPPDTMLNVNIPNLALRKIKGFAVTRMARSRFVEIFHRRTSPRGEVYYWLDGEIETRDDMNGTDIQAVRDGYVALTPICFDLTNHSVMPELKGWNLTRRGGLGL